MSEQSSTSEPKEIPQDASYIPPAAEVEAQDQAEQSEFTLRAILAMTGAFSITFCTVGLTNAFGVFQEYYSETLLKDKSDSTISWIGSFNIFLMFAGMMVVSMLEYKLGPTILIFIGSVITVFSLFMTSLCKEYYQFFLAQGLVLGVGICLTLMPAFVNVPHYFRASRGMAMGIVVSGSSLGGVIWPIVFHRLFSQIGFGWAVRTAAFMMIPLLGLAILGVRRPVGFVPPTRGKPDLSFLRWPGMILLAIGLFFVYLGLFSPFFYITSWTVSLGLNSNLAFYMISIINAASLFGRIIPGYVADRVGPFNTLIAVCLSSGLIATCWTKATTIPGIVVFSLAYGFASGGVISLQGPCAVAPKGLKPPQYGVAMGFVMTTLSIASLIGTPINGQLLSAFGYRGLSLFSGLSMLLGAAIITMARLCFAKGLFVKI